MVGPGLLQSVRLEDHVALSAYIAGQIDMLVARCLLSQLSPQAYAGALAGRITATANAIYQTESTTTWNVLPPSLAVCVAIVAPR